MTVPEGATRLVLIRHGESACSVAGVVGGEKGCTGLSPMGRGQAELLRDRLVRTGELGGASALYVSTLPRAQETALIACSGVGNGELDVLVDHELRELDPGDADGLTWVEFASRYGEPDWDRDPSVPVAPRGESWTEFVERARLAVTRLCSRHPGGLVVAVCHAGIVEASILALLPVAPDRRRLTLRTEPTSMTVWEVEAGNGGANLPRHTTASDGSIWRLLRYNDTSHLTC
jgi:probable phosphoglycerate mutase